MAFRNVIILHNNTHPIIESLFLVFVVIPVIKEILDRFWIHTQHQFLRLHHETIQSFNYTSNWENSAGSSFFFNNVFLEALSMLEKRPIPPLIASFCFSPTSENTNHSLLKPHLRFESSVDMNVAVSWFLLKSMDEIWFRVKYFLLLLMLFQIDFFSCL